MAAPLRAQRGVPVDLAARGDAGRGRVAIGCFSTIEAEADAAVEWVVARRSAPPGRDRSDPVPQAIPVRPGSSRRSRQQVSPTRVAGLGDCCTPWRSRISWPFWVVAQDPTRGDHLMRTAHGRAVPPPVSPDLDGLADGTRVPGRRLAQVEARRSGDEERPDRTECCPRCRGGPSWGLGWEAPDDLPDPQHGVARTVSICPHPALSRLDALGQLICPAGHAPKCPRRPAGRKPRSRWASMSRCSRARLAPGRGKAHLMPSRGGVTPMPPRIAHPRGSRVAWTPQSMKEQGTGSGVDRNQSRCGPGS